MFKFSLNSRLNFTSLVPNPKKLTKKMVSLSETVLGKKIQEGLKETNFSSRAKGSLSRSITVEAKPKSLTVRSSHPGIRQFLYGRRKRQMRWLTGTHSIPIVTREGKLIFRNATSKSMASAGGGPRQGKRGWVHPGRKGDDFVSRAKTKAKEEIKKQFKKMVGIGKRRGG